jgi:hypothetical protein
MTTVICRSLRELDALIDIHLFGVKVPKRRGIVHTPPCYTTYAGMESVVTNRVTASLRFSIDHDDEGAYATLFPNSAVLNDDSPEWQASASDIPVAVCLAALASVGVQVELNMGEPS